MTEWGEDDAVERVLRGLRKAEGAPGMEARVLARVAASKGALAAASASGEGEGLGAGWGRDGRGWRGAWNPTFRVWEVVAGRVRSGARKVGAGGGFGWGGVLAGFGLIVVLVGGDMWVRGRAHAGFSRPVVATAVRVKGARAASGRQGAEVLLAGEGTAAREIRSAVVIGEPKRRTPRRRREIVVAEASSGQNVRPEELSFPAPPMPLTRQERLLLRMLRGGEGAELVATLSRKAESLARLRDDADFYSFFGRVQAGIDVSQPRGDSASDKGSEMVSDGGPAAASQP